MRVETERMYLYPLSDEEMRLMEDFLDKLIYKKEKELNVLKEQFAKY